MRNISDMTVVQIEVTNTCHLRCANCTRHLGHHKNLYVTDFLKRQLTAWKVFLEE